MATVPVPPQQQHFELLKELPSEILERILSNFCDGKALSTLALTVAGDRRYEIFRISIISRQLLLDIADSIERSSREESSDRLYEGAVRWVRSIAADEETAKQKDNEDENCKPKANSRQNLLAARLRRTDTYRRLKAMHRLSENLAVVDFLRQNISSTNQRGRYEWPVWVGQIAVDGASNYTAIQRTAKVVVTAPLQAPSHMPGSTLILNRTPRARFRCEPMNLNPISPWGQIKGLESCDQRTLSSVARLLDEANHVAVVPPALIHRQRDPLDIRILTKRQARQRLNATQLVRKNHWILNGEDGDNTDGETTQLLCCWQDDSEEDPDARSYIAYMIDLMKTRDRLLRESSNGSR